MAKKVKKAKKNKKADSTKKKAKPSKKQAPKRVAKAAKGARPAAKKTAPAIRRAAAAPQPNPLLALARRIIDVTLSDNEEGMYALYADNVESTEMGMPPGVGLSAIKEKMAMWRSMVSEATWKTGVIVADGSTIVIEWIGNVTLAGSGRTVELQEVAVHEIKNGKIARERFYYDPSVLQSAAAPPATA